MTGNKIGSILLLGSALVSIFIGDYEIGLLSFIGAELLGVIDHLIDIKDCLKEKNE